MDEVDGLSGAKGQLVSVIIPYYDRLELLPRALKSVVEQTYRNLEIIIVDDASNQDPRALLASFDDDRIVYIKHEMNQGVSGARNTGIDRARGDLISFLDSDDEWLPTKVERQLDALMSKGNEHTVCYCFSEVVSDETGKVIEVNSFQVEGDVIHPVLVGSGGSSGWTGLVILVNELMLVKDDLLQVGGFDKRYRMHEDWELLIRLARSYKFTCVKEVLVRNHKHRFGHIGDRYQNIPQVRHLIFQEHRDLYAMDKAASSHFFAELAYYEGVNGMKGHALLSLFKSIAYKPFRREPYLKVVMLMMNRLQKPRTEW